jgi:hypothetical protein
MENPKTNRGPDFSGNLVVSTIGVIRPKNPSSKENK